MNIYVVPLYQIRRAYNKHIPQIVIFLFTQHQNLQSLFNMNWLIHF